MRRCEEEKTNETKWRDCAHVDLTKSFSRHDERLARFWIDKFRAGRFAADIDENARCRIERIVNEARFLWDRFCNWKFACSFWHDRNATSFKESRSVYERGLGSYLRRCPVAARSKGPDHVVEQTGPP